MEGHSYVCFYSINVFLCYSLSEVMLKKDSKQNLLTAANQILNEIVCRVSVFVNLIVMTLAPHQPPTWLLLLRLPPPGLLSTDTGGADKARMALLSIFFLLQPSFCVYLLVGPLCVISADLHVWTAVERWCSDSVPAWSPAASSCSGWNIFSQVGELT